MWNEFNYSACLQAAFGQSAFFSQPVSGHSAFVQQLSAFWHGFASGHSALQQESFFSHSAFWQHSTAGLSQHLPSWHLAFLQQPIAQRATAAINKIFFITLKK
jgi:hypothetical protein